MVILPGVFLSAGVLLAGNGISSLVQFVRSDFHGGGRVLDQLSECLAGHFDVEHCTFQLEAPGHREHELSHHA